MLVEAFAARGEGVTVLSQLTNPTARAGVRHIVSSDLANPSAVVAAVGEAAGALGGVDAPVHLVGAFPWVPMEQSSLDTWRDLYTSYVETTLNVDADTSCENVRRHLPAVPEFPIPYPV